MATLTLFHSSDPAVLLEHAARPFTTSRSGNGKNGTRAELPLLAVRQGGIRDQIQELAAHNGGAGWVGKPLVVFAELPALFAGELAPLTAFERLAVLRAQLARVKPQALAHAARQRRLLDALDRLFGDLVSERVSAAGLTRQLALLDSATWEGMRDAEVAALYDAYVGAISSLPAVNGVPRIDGRDARTVAAEAIRRAPDEAARRIRQPFTSGETPRTVSIYGLNDLRRGWDRLLDALIEAPFIAEVHVYLLLDSVERGESLEFAEPIGEGELHAELLKRGGRGSAVIPTESPTSGPLPHLRASLFRASRDALPLAPDSGFAALAAPDMARELEEVARRIKRLIVTGGRDGVPVPPHRIAVVSRKSRPYGDRMTEALRRHGVPVTSRLRSNLGEVAAVAALARVFEAAATGYPWRTLADIAECPYFDVDLDVGVLRFASTRSRLTSLGAWDSALAALVTEAEAEREEDEYRGPPVDRARKAHEQMRAFRTIADQFSVARTRADWISLALRCIGATPGGARAPEGREGVWGLCRNACRPPISERDAVAVDATRRDAEGLECLRGVLVEWNRSLHLDGSGGERLAPAAWVAELRAVLEDTDVTLSTPHRRGVHVLEGSAAAWRTFDHLFLVGLSAGDFPAEPQGRELYADHERERLHESGLPVEPARVWFAREASLFRQLVSGAGRTLHLSYAYADADGSPEIASAYFDEAVGCFAPAEASPAGSLVQSIPGSAIVPPSLDDVWCEGDLLLYAARSGAGTRGTVPAAERIADEARRALGHLAAGAETRDLVQRVLRAARIERDRRALRLEPAAKRADRATAWNGAIDDPELREHLAHAFGDERVWSASQLEAYGKCPFTFFTRYVLGLRELDERDEEIDGATRGRLIHEVLDRLHRTLAHEFGDAALTSNPQVTVRATKVIADAVTRALADAEQRGEAGPPELREYRMAELEEAAHEYFQWEVRENERSSHRQVPRRRPLHTEFVFGFDGRPPVTLHHRGRVIRLRGKIDRVDELIDGPSHGWRYIVDHKTGASALDPVRQYDEGAILQLPLYLHALARAGEGGAGAWGGAYQLAKNDKQRRRAALHPRSLSKGKIREGTTKGEQEDAGRIEAALGYAVEHIDNIRGGRFPAAIPSCSSACPAYCDMRHVCREDR